MEYLDGCSTAMRCVARKVGERWLPWKAGLYDLEVVPPQGHYFWTGRLIYDKNKSIYIIMQIFFVATI